MGGITVTNTVAKVWKVGNSKGPSIRKLGSAKKIKDNGALARRIPPNFGENQGWLEETPPPLFLQRKREAVTKDKRLSRAMGRKPESYLIFLRNAFRLHED